MSLQTPEALSTPSLTDKIPDTDMMINCSPEKLHTHLPTYINSQEHPGIGKPPACPIIITSEDIPGRTVQYATSTVHYMYPKGTYHNFPLKADQRSPHHAIHFLQRSFPHKEHETYIGAAGLP